MTNHMFLCFSPAATAHGRRHCRRLPDFWSLHPLLVFLWITSSFLSSTFSSSWRRNPLIIPVSSFKVMTTMTLHPAQYNNNNINNIKNIHMDIPPSHPIQTAKNPLTGRWIQLTPFSHPNNYDSTSNSKIPSNRQVAERNTTTTTTTLTTTMSMTSTKRRKSRTTSSIWQTTFLEQPGGWMVHRGAIVRLCSHQEEENRHRPSPSSPDPQLYDDASPARTPAKDSASSVAEWMPHQWYTLEPTLAQVEQVVGMEDEEEDWNCTSTTNTTTTVLSLPQCLEVSSLPRASELLWLYKPDGLLTLPGKTEPDSLATQVNEYLNLHHKHQEETQQKETQQEETQHPLQKQALLEQQGQSNNQRQKGYSRKRQVDQQQQQQQRKPQQPAPWVPRPCHRLDRDTSGIIVMATTREAYTALSKQFEQRYVTKQYVALVQGCVETDLGVIDRPIGEKKMTTTPSQQQNGEEAGECSYKVWTTDPGADKARSAVTYYQVSRRYPTTAATPSYTRVILQPQTGRGHQLRLHMAEVLGHPILGDTLHGSNNQQEATSYSGRDNDNSHKSSSAFARMNPPRLCLHAEYLQVWVLDENNQVRQAKCWCLPPF